MIPCKHARAAHLAGVDLHQCALLADPRLRAGMLADLRDAGAVGPLIATDLCAPAIGDRWALCPYFQAASPAVPTPTEE
jgi:hypothetical protein